VKKILDVKNIPVVAAFFQAGLFSIAGDQKFGIFPFGFIVGFGMGIVVNWSMAISSSRISDIAKNRKALAYLSLALLFCLSPAVICSTLGWTVSNFFWSVALDLSILLVGSTTGKSLLPQEARTPAKSARTPTKSVRSAAKYPRKCAHCAEMLSSPNAVGGHMKKNHPQMCKGALAENLFQIDKKGQ
jgi:MFS family permease